MCLNFKLINLIKDELVRNQTTNHPVFSLADLQNGYLASSGGLYDNTIKIWDPSNLSLIQTLTGQTNFVYALASLRNGYLASAGADNSIKIWDLTDGGILRTLTGHSGWIYSLAVLQNGYLASASFDNTIKIWNANDGSLINTLTGHSSFVVSLAVLTSGNLASGSYDKTIKIWSKNDGSLVNTLSGHSSWVVSLAVLQNGNLASGSCDSTIKIWNVTDGSLLRTLTELSYYVYSLAVLRNGYLASSSGDNAIKIWNTDDGSLINTLTGHENFILALAVLQNGYLVSGSLDKNIKIWNTNLYNRFIKVNDLLVYGFSNGDSILTRADDASFMVSLANKYTFYDASYNSIYVSTNGYVCLDGYSTTSISSFSALSSQLIAGLSMDLDTRTSGNIYHRETADSSILASVRSYIHEYGSSKYSSFDLNSAFIVTYDNVPFFGSSYAYNSFQIILTTTSSCETFAVVIYKFMYSGLSYYYAGFSAKNGVLYKQIANSDLSYLANNPYSTLPSYIVYKLSSDNSSLTCSKKN
jgi:WD40 repeat protein